MKLKKALTLVTMVIAFATLVCGCGKINKLFTTNDELALQVKESIEKKFKADKETAKIQIKSLSVVNTKDNDYSGTLKATTPDGEEVTADVKIIYDGETIAWEISAEDMNRLAGKDNDDDYDFDDDDDYDFDDDDDDDY